MFFSAPNPIRKRRTGFASMFGVRRWMLDVGRFPTPFCFDLLSQKREKSSPMKLLLPWICVVALAVGVTSLYLSNSTKEKEITALREQAQQAQTLQTEIE